MKKNFFWPFLVLYVLFFMLNPTIHFHGRTFTARDFTYYLVQPWKWRHVFYD